MKSTACGPSYDYPGDENLVKLKGCTTDARAHLASFDFYYFFFREKNSSISVVSFFNFNYTYPGTSIFFSRKKKERKKHPLPPSLQLKVCNLYI